mmetsp:Transcript_52244/g.124586  ORF Transcript_52244/g.124586 Transcript_52244/m.124586 type:complete len:111 (-) Transcript_52244:129-461(-)|eukprot:CAMPEP_0178431720 /NCGR_PEP_ID=MMETSP0689_2-20121128/32005_1 /TAXON_ID=160604 /ORGANISM="Amphidinium massartii, Strain CS-259" /LENGTH=110 /DNA_ID=CAMNT_0020053665 /DNA_START=78 /DNA_END=410 /DNA_ORIENTATION=-
MVGELRDTRFYLANVAAVGLLTLGVSQLCTSAKVAKPDTPAHWTVSGACGSCSIASAIMLVNHFPFAGLAGCLSAVAPALLMKPKEVDPVTTSLSACLCGWLFFSKHFGK